MRFRTSQRPRGTLRPGDQRRLTGLIAGVGVVMLCFTIVRQPQFWHRLFPAPAAQTQAISVDATSNSRIRLNDAIAHSEGIRHDEFLSGAPISDEKAALDTVTVTANRLPLAIAESSDAPPLSVPRVPKDLLKTVKDDVIGVYASESQAYYATLKMATLIDRKKTTALPTGAFALFMDSPNGSRGMAWRVEGSLRRLATIKERPNPYGGGKFYDAWITTPDSGNQLLHVIATNADATLTKLLPPKSSQQQTSARTVIEFTRKTSPDVKFTGYFFKREGYASRQGVSLAPLLLAGTLHEVPARIVTSTRAEQLTPYLGWLTIAVCGTVALVWCSFLMSDAAHSRTRAHALTRLPACASFENVTAKTVGEALGDLEA
ncbi:MAG: hypothetical protein GY758_10080 [Fuerstiella sp.]|nr:hypothetical protein [Fuerstiella sp.]